MPTNPDFENYFQSIAESIANKNRTSPKRNTWSGFAADVPAASGQQQTGSTSSQQKKESDWNLGQGLIDLLSTGTYAVAGIGQGLAKGDFNILGTAAKGINERRSWQQNLKDWDQVTRSSATAQRTGVTINGKYYPNWQGANAEQIQNQASQNTLGFVLDVALDPFWFIPGGSVAAGVKGTARGIGVGSALNKAGVPLNKAAIQDVKTATEGFSRPGLRNLALGEKENPLGALEGVLQPTGKKIPAYTPQGIQNFYQGIKQANIENYVELAAARRAAKLAKQQRKAAKLDVRTGGIPLLDDVLGQIDEVAKDVSPDPIVREAKAKAQAAPAPTPTQPVADQVADTIVEKVDTKTRTKTKPAVVKDPESVQRAVDTALGKGDPLEESSKQLGGFRDEYANRYGLDPLKVDLKAAKAADYAPEMAKVYDNLVSAPNDPAVRSAYAKLVEETRQQYKYMTEELGIKVDFINEDPYTKIGPNGPYPSPRAMAEDVAQNKHLYVRASEPDFVTNPHPILTAEENNLFRAVHDFFGHAASGRGFLADGEEAAWMSHSTMFSPEARRAMTTETRGQNSYYNFLNPADKKFAPQKAALFPEEYTLLPAELDALTGQITRTNTFFGRVTTALTQFADNILDDLSLVKTPIKGSKEYTPERLTQIDTAVRDIVKQVVYREGTPEHKTVVAALDGIIKNLSRQVADVSFIDRLKDLKNVSGTSAELVQQILDQPIVINELVQQLAAAEGRYLSAPAPFKPTVWGPRYEPTAASKFIGQNPDVSVGFTQDHFAKFFPNDPLLDDAKNLGIAFGKTPLKQAKIYIRKGESPLEAYKRYQSTIWEDFRTRNMSELENVKTAERAAYDAKYSQLDAEIFVRRGEDNKLIGVSQFPDSLPRAMVSGSFDGSVTTSLGRMVEYLSRAVERVTPRAVAGTAGTSVVGGKTVLKDILLKGERVTDEDGAIIKEITADEAIPSIVDAENVTGVAAEELIRMVKGGKVVGAQFKVVDANGKTLKGIATRVANGEKFPTGASIVPQNAAAKKVLTSLRKNKPEIKVDTLNPIIQRWMVGEFTRLRNSIKESGIVYRNAGQTAADVEANVSKLLGTGLISSYADAKMVLTGGKEALKALGKKVSQKLYVKGADSVRRSLKTGATQNRTELLRDPMTGAPMRTVKQGENVRYEQSTEAKADVIGEYPEYRLLTTEGSAFTGRQRGRAGMPFAEQTGKTGKGTQQLAGLQSVRDTLGAITDGIKAKEFAASPEQAQLLSGVMTSLGIKIADDASPAQIFKMFEEKAALGFQEMVDSIQAAAKQEAVIYQARNVFNRSINQNMSLMKVIDSLEPGELQRSVVEFTDNAISLVDDYCAWNYSKIGGPATPQTGILEELGNVRRISDIGTP